MTELAFFLPNSLGEWLVGLTYLGVLLNGLLLVGRSITKRQNNPASTLLGSLYAGIGFTMLLLEQPLFYITVSIIFVFAIIGCVIHIALHPKIFGSATIISLIGKVLVVILPIAYVLGFIA